MSTSSTAKKVAFTTTALGATAITTGLVLDSGKEIKEEEIKKPETIENKEEQNENNSETVVTVKKENTNSETSKKDQTQIKVSVAKEIKILNTYDRNKYRTIGPNTQIPNLTYRRPDYMKPSFGGTEDREFLLIRLGKPTKESTITDNMKVEEILKTVYQKQYTPKEDKTTMKKRVTENWTNLMNEKNSIRDQSSWNKKVEALISECEATKNNEIEKDWFQVQLDFAVKYCLEDSDEIRNKTYTEN